ncbi:MAG: hypothetical protein AAFS10_17780, partial [Myxococcota bacterium]
MHNRVRSGIHVESKSIMSLWALVALVSTLGCGDATYGSSTVVDGAPDADVAADGESADGSVNPDVTITPDSDALSDSGQPDTAPPVDSSTEEDTTEDTAEPDVPFEALQARITPLERLNKNISGRVSGEQSTGLPPLSYRWRQVSGPPAIVDQPTDRPDIYVYSNISGEVELELVVSSQGMDSEPARTTVTIVNQAPVVDAGQGRRVSVGLNHGLSGEAADPNDDPLTLAWRQLEGPPVTLEDADTLTPTFRAPDEPATLVFELSATDNEEASTTDTVTMEVGLFYTGADPNMGPHPFRHYGNAQGAIVGLDWYRPPAGNPLVVVGERATVQVWEEGVEPGQLEQLSRQYIGSGGLFGLAVDGDVA